MGRAQRDYVVDWRFISLRQINAHLDHDSHFPPEYEAQHTAGLRLPRVASAVRERHGREAVGPLYAAFGARIMETAPDDSREPGRQDSPALAAAALTGAGLPASLAEFLDDTPRDSEEVGVRPTRRRSGGW